MTSLLGKEIEDLKKTLLDMMEVVDSMLEKSIGLIRDPSDSKSRIAEIKKMDDDVDSKEVDLDGKCVRLLSLYAPEAEMLRTTIAVMKINNDVERIGDHAVNVARLVGKSSDFPPLAILNEAAEMGEKALEMFRMSVDAFINKREDLTLEVSKKDAEVDMMEKEIVEGTLRHAEMAPEATPAATCAIVIARNLERAADLSTNIAEDTHYLITGNVIKHS
ncbi:MAG: phosphate signaling complex protein PhoU [Candidatus Mycalebacterium zealandia]|nr:MAG: phosphate signaling complex protein PhoU [Candidatus Mycalebacterium zealandia]